MPPEEFMNTIMAYSPDMLAPLPAAKQSNTSANPGANRRQELENSKFAQVCILGGIP